MPDSTYNEGIAIQNLKLKELKSILLHTGNEMNKFLVSVVHSYKNRYNDKFALKVGRSVINLDGLDTFVYYWERSPLFLVVPEEYKGL